MLAGAAEAPLCPLTFTAFDQIKTMSRWDGEPVAHACRPFDANRDGFVMGEGAACLVVEELEHALRRGAKIYAELLGYALNNEAYHMTTPQPGGECVIRCMQSALEDARLPASDIGYINCHASSTPLNDANETLAIKQVFGIEKTPPISGTKSITAHPLGATSAIESVLCALALQHQILPPTLHYQTPDPECDLDVVPNAARPSAFRYVLNNAFGFGGINSCLVMGALS
jgi:3-oxoacyl-[acyl-carrier-protein] synthase II